MKHLGGQTQENLRTQSHGPKTLVNSGVKSCSRSIRQPGYRSEKPFQDQAEWKYRNGRYVVKQGNVHYIYTEGNRIVNRQFGFFL